MVGDRPATGRDLFARSMRGVCPVIEVPFAPDGAVDYEGFGRVVDHVLATGVSAVICPAFASEFYKLSDAERTSVRAHLLSRTKAHPEVVAVIGVAQHATRLARAEAEAAVTEGAGALNVLPPHFLGPSPGEVMRHLQVILEAVAPTPVIVQHAPGLAASAIGARELCALAGEHENLRMVKVEAVPPGRFITALARGQVPLPSMVGYGGVMMIDALRRGAVGVQPGCSAVEIYQAIWAFWESGDHGAAEALHRRLLPYVSYWMQEVEMIIQVEKTITKERGLIRDDHCRAPGRQLDDEERRSVTRFLSEFGDILGGQPSLAPATVPAASAHG